MDEHEQKRRYRASIPTTRQGAYIKLWERAMAGRSKVAAIKVKCLDCCGWQKEEVRNCQVPACPLYPYRPYQ